MKQPALRLSRTKNLHFAKATFPGFSAYAAYIASIHLVAIRFCMLISAKHNSVAAGFSEVRSSLSHNLRDINYAALGLGCPKQAFAKIATPRVDTLLFQET
jgi:hypothetical protein